MKYDKTSNNDNEVSAALKAVLFRAAVGATICAGFLFLFAFLFVVVKSIPQYMIQTIAIFCASVGAFVSGYISVKIYRSKGLIYGALAGILLFFMLTVVAFIISRDKFTYITLVRFFSMIFSGALGGVLAVNKKRRK